MGRFHTRGEGIFKGFDRSSADVLAAAQNLEYRLLKIRAQIADLLAEAEGGNLHEANLKGGSAEPLRFMSGVPLHVAAHRSLLVWIHGRSIK